MGKLVAGLFSTHVPRLMIFDEAARRAYMKDEVSTFYAALEEIRREKLASLDFDTFVVVDTHWHSTLDFLVNAHDRLRGLYTSDELPQMLGEECPGGSSTDQRACLTSNSTGAEPWATPVPSGPRNCGH